MSNVRIPWYLVGTVLVCGGSAAVASFAALGALARHLGWPGWTWALLPIMVDTLSAAALIVWLKPGFPADARAFARKVALGSIGYSAVANAISHVIEGRGLGWTTVLTVLVGASPAIAAALAVELAIKITGPLKRAPKPVKVQAVEPKPEPAAASSGPTEPAVPLEVPSHAPTNVAPIPAQRVGDDELLVKLRELHTGETVSAYQVRKLGITNGKGRSQRLAEQYNAEAGENKKSSMNGHAVLTAT